jgi:hypothetical protein
MKLKVYYRLPVGKDGKCQVQITYAHAGQPTLKIPTGLRANPKSIDDDMGQKIRDEYNYIDGIVSDYYRSHNRTYPLPTELKVILDVPKQSTDEVATLYEAWVNRATFRAKKLHRTVIGDIKECLPNLTLAQTTIENLDKLKNFWINNKIANSTTKKRMQFFLRFLKNQDKTVYKPNLEYRLYSVADLKTPKRDENIFTLTEKEFTVLLDFKFSNPQRQYAVDLYLLSCATGLRIADVTSVSPATVIDDEDGIPRIKVPIQKNDGRLSDIPLNKFSRQIIYERNLNIKMTEQHIRQYLKDAFAEALPLLPRSFVKVVTKYRWEGGYPKHQKEPKYKFLVFHTSRKFFASYFTTLVGRELTKHWGGWSTSGSFDRYVKNDFNEKDVLKKIQ